MLGKVPINGKNGEVTGKNGEGYVGSVTSRASTRLG